MAAEQALGVAAQERRSGLPAQVQGLEDHRRECRVVPEHEGETQERSIGPALQLGAGARELGRRVQLALDPPLPRATSTGCARPRSG